MRRQRLDSRLRGNDPSADVIAQGPIPNDTTKWQSPARCGTRSLCASSLNAGIDSLHRRSERRSRLRNAADVRSNSVQLFLNSVVPAIDVVDAINQGLTLGGEAGED